MPFLTDNQQARFTVRIPHVGIAHQLVGDGTPKVEADDLRDIRYSQLVNILTVNPSEVSFVSTRYI